MATSYHRIFSDHLTGHLIYLSSSSSFWFGAGGLLHCLPSHIPLIVSSRPPLVLLSCQLVFESPIVTRPSRPLVTPPSRLLAASAGCRIASCRPFVAPPSCRLTVAALTRRAAVSSTHRASLLAIECPPHRRHCRLHRPPPPPPPPPALSSASPSCIDKESSSSLLPPPPLPTPLPLSLSLS
jgi:hypothetical protein